MSNDLLIISTFLSGVFSGVLLAIIVATRYFIAQAGDQQVENHLLDKTYFDLRVYEAEAATVKTEQHRKFM